MSSSIGVSSSLLTSDGAPVLEPGALFVDGSYALRLNAWCSIAGVALALRSRFLRVSDGQLVNSGDLLTVSAGRTLNTVDVLLGVGFPINVMVFATAGAPLVGQCFAQVQIVSGVGAASVPLATVLQGYVTATQALSWPGSPIVSSTSGEPAVRTIVGTAPGGGADILETVPAAARWELLSVDAALTLGAGAAATSGYCTLDDGANVYARVRTGNSGGLTTVNPFTWSQFVPFQNVTVSGGVFNLMPLTANRMLAGHRFQMKNDNGAGQKTWSAPVYNVREWLDV